MEEGRAASDFTIESPGAHGLDGLIDICGTGSPGLTASLAISGNVSQKAALRAAA